MLLNNLDFEKRKGHLIKCDDILMYVCTRVYARELLKYEMTT